MTLVPFHGICNKDLARGAEGRKVSFTSAIVGGGENFGHAQKRAS